MELQQCSHIITTEKDYMRLRSHIPEERLWFQPMQVTFLKDGDVFDSLILECIKK